ncbi:serine carboxypeptidase 1-like [Actinidia eriantha]|uniref:serine carboxypeptidase 1-like n=1 Tax=Actinidia eriantha TaxID=165200 RepID=UPI0025901F8A|nr:serine carboxypeptidase 1-like [Actinidia eriantha]
MNPLGELIREELSKKKQFDASKDVGFGLDTSKVGLGVYLGPQDGLKEGDKILGLPGQPNGVGFDQYSGYVTVDPVAGRALFYYLVECPHNSSTKPLVLWLNGGPGCSSLIGAMEELGPFRVNKDGQTLWPNEYAWNHEANILFLESPAGVGFSYSNTTSDYELSGDNSTAHDSYTFLVNWLERFHEYKSRDLYIAGESYAGHYVPQLAQTILHNNNFNKQTIIINLRGIAIGNAYIDYETNEEGSVDYYLGHALISEETHNRIVLNCNYSSPSSACEAYWNQAHAEMGWGSIYPYDIYAPLCNSGSDSLPISAFDPCSGNYVNFYLNIPQVQKALHANVTGLPYPWQICSREIRNLWKDIPLTVLPIISELMSSGIRIWIYSGDTDSVVTVTSSRYSIRKLGASVKTPWYPWYVQEEVGGYAVEYHKNLTFVSIRGSGHFVPSYQPARALVMFSSFINGKLPPSDTTNQADKLYDFIKSRKSETLLDAESWAELDRAIDKDYSLVYVRDQYGLMEVDKLDTLPGQPEGVNFNQYAGCDLPDPVRSNHATIFLHDQGQDAHPLDMAQWKNWDPLELTAMGKHCSEITMLGTKIRNAWIDDNTGTKGIYEYYWTHALNSDESNSGINKYCDFLNGNFSSACYDYQNQGDVETGVIDICNIYAPFCNPSAPEPPSPGSIQNFDPCSSNNVYSYLNLPEVQKALHTINTTCGVGWTDSPSTILIKQLIGSGIRLWVYSGYIDGRVPIASSRHSINTFKLPVVGGYVVGYQRLVLITVRGAGHTVPSYQPERALTIKKYFLNGTLPPSS